MVSSVPAGLAIVPAAALCLGYLLPYVARQRARAWQVPLEDRFSANARVIEPAATAPQAEGSSSVPLLSGTNSKRTAPMHRPATSRPAKPVRPIQPARAGELEPAAARRRAAGRPQDSGPERDPSSADQRAARTRAAAIRAGLAGSFALLTILAVVLAVTADLSAWAAVTCAALTTGVLVSGQRAARADARARAAWDTAPTGARPAGTVARGSAPGAAQSAAERPGAAGASSRRAPAARVADGRRTGTGTRQAAARPQVGGSATAVGRPNPKASATAARGRAQGERAASADSPDSTGARRPGLSGRISGGRTTYHLPPSAPITPLDLDGEAARPAGRRRFTTARPTIPTLIEPPADSAPTAATSEDASSDEPPKPKRAPARTAVPAPTYAMMPGAPKWEPEALTALDYAKAREAAARVTQRAAAEALAEGLETPATGPIKIPGRVVFAEDALDLDRAIAARRRAAGR
ncbi:MAG: hypothetical protein LBD77_03415 [Bifidobacteriaceae bacterium]|jgi:hypothetical protein|nr:hypothetical protein [Bifidobacteriaceae bacterium]